jgi:hypothetical protein
MNDFDRGFDRGSLRFYYKLGFILTNGFGTLNLRRHNLEKKILLR